jgi:hypothetical protein
MLTAGGSHRLTDTEPIMIILYQLVLLFFTHQRRKNIEKKKKDTRSVGWRDAESYTEGRGRRVPSG